MNIILEVTKACDRFGIPKSSILKNIKTWNITPGEGLVSLGRTWRAQKSADIPRQQNFLNIYVCKGKGKIGNSLSPFNLLVPSYGGMFPLELVWQASKRQEGESQKQHENRRSEIYRKGIVKRRYIKGSCVGAMFEDDPGVLVNYIDSRIQYCTLYEKAVVKQNAFMFLVYLVRVLKVNLILLGPDGHPCHDLAKAYQDPSLPFGHERVLMSLLSDNCPWKHLDEDEN